MNFLNVNQIEYMHLHIIYTKHLEAKSKKKEKDG